LLLFLYFIQPWSDIKYKYIQRTSPNKILIWGYITLRYDFDIIKKVAIKFPKYQINIIGDIHAKAQVKVNHLISTNNNIKVHFPVKLDEIDLENYFTCFAPYVLSDETQAISITNKSFQVFARGLPMVNAGMPNFIEETFIFNCKSIDNIFESIDLCSKKNGS
jgi:hypothetical protein